MGLWRRNLREAREAAQVLSHHINVSAPVQYLTPLRGYGRVAVQSTGKRAVGGQDAR